MAAAEGRQQEQTAAALSLLQRLPPKDLEANLAGLRKAAPHLEKSLAPYINRPLQVGYDPERHRYFVQSDYNCERGRHRSPWSNRYLPQAQAAEAEEEPLSKPSERLRSMEEAWNEVFDAYKTAYYDGGVSSVYLWDLDEGFAGAFLIRKELHGSHEIVQAVWDSVHILEVSELQNKNGTEYKLSSTVLLHLQLGESGKEETEMSGLITRQAELKSTRPKKTGEDLLAHCGRMIEENELFMRQSLDNLYMAKQREVLAAVRRLEPLEPERPIVTDEELRKDRRTLEAAAEAERRQARDAIERQAREEAERQARDAIERQAREEAERRAKEERSAREKAEREARERGEKEAQLRAKQEAENRAAAEKARKEKAEEAERKDRERAEARRQDELKATAEQDRLAKERAAAAQKAQEEADAAAREAASQKAKEEAERKAREQEEAEQRARDEEAALRKAREAEEQARLQAEREAMEQKEAEQRAPDEDGEESLSLSEVPVSPASESGASEGHEGRRRSTRPARDNSVFPKFDPKLREHIANSCFDHDWSLLKANDNLLPQDPTELDAVAEQIRISYLWLLGLYRKLSSQNIGQGSVAENVSVFGVTQRSAINLLDSDAHDGIDIIDKSFSKANAETIYKAVLSSANKEGMKKNFMCHADSRLVRFQFVEFLLRVAEDKYSEQSMSAAAGLLMQALSGICERYSGDVKSLFQTASDDRVENTYKKLRSKMERIYAVNATAMTPGGDYFMSLSDWMKLLKQSNAHISAGVKLDDWPYCYRLGLETEPDEQYSCDFQRMSLREFERGVGAVLFLGEVRAKKECPPERLADLLEMYADELSRLLLPNSRPRGNYMKSKQPSGGQANKYRAATRANTSNMEAIHEGA